MSRRYVCSEKLGKPLTWVALGGSPHGRRHRRISRFSGGVEIACTHERADGSLNCDGPETAITRANRRNPGVGSG